MPVSCVNTFYNHCRRAQCIDSNAISLKLMHWKIRLLKMFITTLGCLLLSAKVGKFKIFSCFYEFAQQNTSIIACADCS